MEQDKYSISWKDLPWKKFKKKSFRLQCKIYDAKQKGNCKTVRRLQKLLLYSKSLHYIAICHVLRQNSLGKINFLMYGEMLGKLLNELPTLIRANAKLTLKVVPGSEISNKVGLLFDLRSKVLSYIWEMVLEPVSQVILRVPNYINNRILDIQRGIISNFGALTYSEDTKILEIGISKMLIEHEHMISIETLGSGLSIIHKLISSKIHNIGGDTYLCIQLSMCGEMSFLTVLLKNILLQGYRDLDDEIEKRVVTFYDSLKSNFISNNSLLYILKTDIDKSLLLYKIADFLGMRSIKLTHNIIKLFSPTHGFDFLAWHFKMNKSRKLLRYPNNKNWSKCKRKIKTILGSAKDPLLLRIEKLMCLSHMWRMRYQFSQMSSLKAKVYYLNLLFNRNFVPVNNRACSILKLYTCSGRI